MDFALTIISLALILGTLTVAGFIGLIISDVIHDILYAPRPPFLDLVSSVRPRPDANKNYHADPAYDQIMAAQDAYRTIVASAEPSPPAATPPEHR